MVEKPAKPDPMAGNDLSSTDWSTKVANSSPLPQRKPGMRHPGVEKFKDPSNRRNDGGAGRNRRGRGARKNIGSQNSENDKPLANNGQSAGKAASKKLTLADTKPKKGEVSNINIRETSAVGGGNCIMTKPDTIGKD